MQTHALAHAKIPSFRRDGRLFLYLHEATIANSYANSREIVRTPTHATRCTLLQVLGTIDAAESMVAHHRSKG